MRSGLLAAAISAVLLLLTGCDYGAVPQPPELAPDRPISLKVDPAAGTPGTTVTVSLRVREPERIARRAADGSFLGWVCFRECGGDGASTDVTFTPSPGDPRLFTAQVAVPVMLRRDAGPSAGKGVTPPDIEPMVAGEYQVHAACVLDRAGGCANRAEVSTTFRLSRGVEMVAWEELPAAGVTPVQRLGAMTATSRSPLPGSQRSVECVSGNLDPRPGEATPRLLLTDDDGRPLPPILFREGGPLFGRHGYAGCGAVALDPVDTDTFYLLEAPHAGGTEPGAFPWPQFTRDGGATWAPVPAPEGFEARRSFVGFTVTADGVTTWFSRASLEERTIEGDQIRGSFTQDGGQSWATVGPSCPEAPAACLWQVRDLPPGLASGLIRSLDGGKSWSWAALSGIPFTADEVYALDGSGGKVLEAVGGSPALYWGFMPLLRSEDGGANWRWVQVPPPPAGWQEAAGFAPAIRLETDGALLLGRTGGQGPARWYRLDRGSTEWTLLDP